MKSVFYSDYLGGGLFDTNCNNVVATYKYLGNYILDDLSDDDDINRQHRTLYVQGNIILRKFSMCSLDVKLTVSFILLTHVWSTTLVELQEIHIKQIAYCISQYFNVVYWYVKI